MKVRLEITQEEIMCALREWAVARGIPLVACDEQSIKLQRKTYQFDWEDSVMLRAVVSTPTPTRPRRRRPR